MRIGQKVICLRDDWLPLLGGYLPPYLPRKNCEYLIRTVGVSKDGYAIRLHWLINPSVPSTEIEPRFGTIGFDGLPNFKIVTDISMFEEMLASKKLETV